MSAAAAPPGGDGEAGARRPADAVVAVIVRDLRVLMVRRARGRPAAGWWCPPSGRVEPGETQPATVAREMREELGVEATALRYLASEPTEDGAFLLHYWRTRVLGEVRLDPVEASDHAWCDAAALRALHPTFAADVRICLAELASELARSARRRGRGGGPGGVVE